ncbi:hypothetical protein J4429_04845 [Candidatus Pacearchaeota archaeon]|nr:hypothetical protein [Candidatus Pacearchaeota archaeon]
MENHLLKTPGAWDEIDIRCPNCGSNMVSIITNSFGYYEVSECKKCGYKNNAELIS